MDLWYYLIILVPVGLLALFSIIITARITRPRKHTDDEEENDKKEKSEEDNSPDE